MKFDDLKLNLFLSKAKKENHDFAIRLDDIDYKIGDILPEETLDGTTVFFYKIQQPRSNYFYSYNYVYIVSGDLIVDGPELGQAIFKNCKVEKN